MKRHTNMLCQRAKHFILSSCCFCFLENFECKVFIFRYVGRQLFTTDVLRKAQAEDIENNQVVDVDDSNIVFGVQEDELNELCVDACCAMCVLTCELACCLESILLLFIIHLWNFNYNWIMRVNLFLWVVQWIIVLILFYFKIVI